MQWFIETCASINRKAKTKFVRFKQVLNSTLVFIITWSLLSRSSCNFFKSSSETAEGHSKAVLWLLFNQYGQVQGLDWKGMKSSQCQKENLKILENYCSRKKWQENSSQNIKKWGVARDFCTLMFQISDFSKSSFLFLTLLEDIWVVHWVRKVTACSHSFGL